MELTSEVLARYEGGQVSIAPTSPSAESFLYRAQIERAWVEPGGIDEKGVVNIQFKWLAQQGEDGRWRVAEDEPLEYSFDVAMTSFSLLGPSALSCHRLILWESVTFHTPHHSGDLDPTEVEGLQLPA